MSTNTEAKRSLTVGNSGAIERKWWQLTPAPRVPLQREQTSAAIDEAIEGLNNQTLQSLFLYYAEISDSDLERLNAAISENTSLQRIHLDNVYGSNQPLVNLLQTVVGQKNITHIETMRVDSVTSAHYDALATSILENKPAHLMRVSFDAAQWPAPDLRTDLQALLSNNRVEASIVSRILVDGGSANAVTQENAAAVLSYINDPISDIPEDKRAELTALVQERRASLEASQTNQQLVISDVATPTTPAPEVATAAQEPAALSPNIFEARLAQLREAIAGKESELAAIRERIRETDKQIASTSAALTLAEQREATAQARVATLEAAVSEQAAIPQHQEITREEVGAIHADTHTISQIDSLSSLIQNHYGNKDMDNGFGYLALKIAIEQANDNRRDIFMPGSLHFRKDAGEITLPTLEAVQKAFNESGVDYASAAQDVRDLMQLDASAPLASEGRIEALGLQFANARSDAAVANR